MGSVEISLPAEADHAGISGDEAGDDIKAGGFTSAIGPKEANDFTLTYTQVDIIDDGAASVGFH